MRTSTGCKTCKIRHRKCDGRRPQCQNCTTRGLTCGGFGIDLKWFNESGDARKATRADKTKRPDSSSSKPTPETDRSSAVPDHGALFEKFVVSGHRMLLGSETEDSAGQSDEIRQLGILSKGLFGVCVAVQLHFDRGGDAYFHEAYKDALAAFRDELQRQDDSLSDSLLVAGIILCTVEILQGNPWTLHLNGLALLLQTRLQQPVLQSSRTTTRITEILAVMELPLFVIGRTTRGQGLWARYRASRMFFAVTPDSPDQVEEMSGLPMTLIDLLVPDPVNLSERDLWDWPGAAGTPMNIQLWEAYRLAAILDRRLRRSWAASSSLFNLDMESPGSVHTPSNDYGTIKITTRVLALRCLGALQAIYQGTIQATPTAPEDLGVTTCVTYPLFVISLHIQWCLRKAKDTPLTPPSDDAKDRYENAWSNIIEPWWKYLESMYKSESVKMQRRLVQEVINRNVGGPVSIDDVARSQNMEVTLL